MITEDLVFALSFLCITFGIVLILSFIFYWAYKLIYYEENNELKRLREEVKSKNEQILGLRFQLNWGHYNEKK